MCMHFDTKYLVHEEQAFEGIYDFTGRILMGREFYEFYSPISEQIAAASVAMVRKIENADYIQVFRYEDTEWFPKEQKFYVISGFEKNTSPEDYVGADGEFYVSVVLPSER